MIPVDTNLSSGSELSFPTPCRWKGHTGNDITSHSGKVSILLGGDNFIYHLATVASDKWGVTLLQSKLSNQHIIFGPVDPSFST